MGGGGWEVGGGRTNNSNIKFKTTIKTQMHTNNSNQNSKPKFTQPIQAKVHTNHSNRPSKTYIQPQFQLTIQTNNSTTQFKQTIHTNKNFPKQQESEFPFLSNINSGNTRKMVLKTNTESFVFGTKFAKQFSTTKVCVCVCVCCRCAPPYTKTNIH